MPLGPMDPLRPRGPIRADDWNKVAEAFGGGDAALAEWQRVYGPRKGPRAVAAASGAGPGLEAAG